MNRKILMMKAVLAAASCLLLFAFYRKGGNGGLYYFLIVSVVFFAVGRLEEYGNRKAVASFHARKEAAYLWMGQNLTGNRIADLKLIRKQFGLPGGCGRSFGRIPQNRRPTKREGGLKHYLPSAIFRRPHQ